MKGIILIFFVSTTFLTVESILEQSRMGDIVFEGLMR
jgi:hypothetical protein